MLLVFSFKILFLRRFSGRALDIADLYLVGRPGTDVRRESRIERLDERRACMHASSAEHA